MGEEKLRLGKRSCKSALFMKKGDLLSYVDSSWVMAGDVRRDEENIGNVGGHPCRGHQHVALLPPGRWLGAPSVGETSPVLRHESCRGREKGTGRSWCKRKEHGKMLSGGRLKATAVCFRAIYV